MNMLYATGNIVHVNLPASVSPEEIDARFTALYSQHPAVKSGQVLMSRWRLLIQVSRSKGARPILKANKVAGDVIFQDVVWCVDILAGFAY